MNSSMAKLVRRFDVASAIFVVFAILFHEQAQAQTATGSDNIALHREAVETEAKALTDKCWAQADREHGTDTTHSMMRMGVHGTSCIQEEMARMTGQMFRPDVVSSEFMSDRLETIGAVLEQFYWDLNNRHRGCRGFCPTIYRVIYLIGYERIQGKMLRDMINKRYEYGLGR